MKVLKANMEQGQARLLRLCAAAAITLSMFSASPATAIRRAPAGPPTLVVTAPTQVAVGAQIRLDLAVENATDIAGYEMALLYDTSAAEFSGVQQRQNDLKLFGRDVNPLTAVDLSAGVSIGLFSCPVADCVSGQGGPALQAASVSLKLATVVLVTKAPGHLEIKLDAVKFVDSAGNEVAVELPQTSVVVQVGAAADDTALAAPDSMWSLTPAGSPSLAPAARGPFDLTNDGQVSFADAMELAIEWQLLRQNETACGALPDASRDVNHDGCLDVADLQLLAANFGAERVAGLSRDYYLPLVMGGSGDGEVVTPSLMATVWVVNTTSDQGDGNIGNGVCRTGAGTCSLRAAIQEANAHAGPDTINFNIPGGGVQTIVLNNKLPTLTDGGTTIDGYTQPGAAVNSDPLVDNAILMIQIEGSGSASFDGFVITSANNTIRGLALYQLQRSFWIYGSGATNNAVVGCFVGTNAAGNYSAPALSLYAHGFHLEQGASYNYIGSPTLSDRNVISGNARHGLGIWHENSRGNVVQNNLIGLNPSGTGELPNRKHGLDINFGSSNNVFGGTGTYERNVVSGNDDSGAEVSHTELTTQNQVVGNFIGTDPSGNSSPAWAQNGGRGLMLEDGATGNTVANNVFGTNGQGAIEVYDDHTFGNLIRDNRIGISLNGTSMPSSFGIWVKGGGLTIGPGNLIAYSNNVGIKIEGDLADNNTITRNSIFSNVGLGIDVFPRGSNPPGGYPTSGPNQGINAPSLQTATPDYVSGMTCGSCTVEIFIAEGGAGAYGEGQTFVGAGTASGGGSFTIAITGVSQDQLVTATATDGAGNTSEFAQNLLVAASGGPTPTPGPTGTPAPTTYVSDTFTRSISDGWGGPDTGGTYTLLSGATANLAFDVNGSAGLITIPSAGVGREAILASISQTDIDVSFQVSTNKASVGDSQEVLLIGRRVNTDSMYRLRVRFAASGAVSVQATRGLNGAWTTLSGLVLVPGVTHAPGTTLLVHGQMVGTNPTTLRLNVWPQGQAEPGGWAYSVTDSSAALQTSGAVGLRSLLSAAASNAPVEFTFDNYLVTSP